MALSKPSVEYTLSLYNKGHFKGLRRILELGTQDLNFQPREKLRELLHAQVPALGGPRIDSAYAEALASSTPDEFRVEWFYRLLGFDEYRCVDADGRYDAMVWDLNLPIPEDHRGRYDLLTNHGTLEHVFNVYQSFKNLHDLAHKGSLILHLIPFQGHVDHGFFNFQPVLFDDLAAENGYEIVDRSVIIYKISDNAETAVIVPYERQAFKKLYLGDKESEANYAVTLRKMTDAEFRSPFQGIYGYSCLIPTYRNSLAQRWAQRVMTALFRDPESMPRRVLRRVKGFMRIGKS